jgi:hypothetical protein
LLGELPSNNGINPIALALQKRLDLLDTFALARVGQLKSAFEGGRVLAHGMLVVLVFWIHSAGSLVPSPRLVRGAPTSAHAHDGWAAGKPGIVAGRVR